MLNALLKSIKALVLELFSKTSKFASLVDFLIDIKADVLTKFLCFDVKLVNLLDTYFSLHFFLLLEEARLICFFQ